MSNEIIIDGVNVEECEFYTKGISDFCIEKDWYCSDIKDCYFKQLQRLKKENEELKQYKQSKQASYEAMQTEWNNAINTLRDVEAENEKIKILIEEIKEIASKECEKCQKEELNNDYCIGSEFCSVAKINEALNQ